MINIVDMYSKFTFEKNIHVFRVPAIWQIQW